jgi:valyl-tRNA synthetase
MLDKKYNHKTVEEGKYDYWLKHGYFNSGDKSKIPYTIVIPPPNVTGKLHLGHAWDTTLQDIMLYGFQVWIMQELQLKLK